MENTVKIEQVDLPHASKLDATMKVTKTVEISNQVTFLGVINQIAAIVKQTRDFEAQKEEMIDLAASIASVQTYSEEEIAQIEKMVMLDAETKSELLFEIKSRVDLKRHEGSVVEVGEIEKASIVPAPVVDEVPAAPVDELPVTEEMPAAAEEEIVE